jgi:transposase
MIKIDLLTGEKFESNRINQNFINSKNRIKYYNGKAKEQRQRMAYINKPLQKNLQILDDVLANRQEHVVHKQFLLGKGYSFCVFTHYEMYQEKQHRALYNYILILLNTEQIKIIRK